MPVPSPALRQLLLAAQVLDDLDLDLTESGAVLADGPPVLVRWSSLLAAVGGAPLPSERARRRLVAWLGVRRAVAAMPVELLAESIRPVGLPRGHVLHPGRGWARAGVLGDVLELGPGVLGLRPSAPEEVAIVEPSVWRAARLDPGRWWPQCLVLVEEMGTLAARRWELSPDGVLRPMGDCDVMTLLGARTLRAALAASDAGMRAVVVPMRRRGWTRLSRLDPAFGPAAAMATAPEDRGFIRPLLVTRDEVALAGDGRRTEISLRGGVGEPWHAAAAR